MGKLLVALLTEAREPRLVLRLTPLRLAREVRRALTLLPQLALGVLACSLRLFSSALGLSRDRGSVRRAYAHGSQLLLCGGKLLTQGRHRAVQGLAFAAEYPDRTALLLGLRTPCALLRLELSRAARILLPQLLHLILECSLLGHGLGEMALHRERSAAVGPWKIAIASLRWPESGSGGAGGALGGRGLDG